jgi:hypothetical protein
MCWIQENTRKLKDCIQLYWKHKQCITILRDKTKTNLYGVYINKKQELLLCHKWKPDCIWNVMAHTQKPDFVFLRNGRVHLNQRGRQFSRLLAAEVCASAVVMLDTPRSEVMWRVLATHSVCQFPLHFPSRASPCAITFQLDCTGNGRESTQSMCRGMWGGMEQVHHFVVV